MPTIRVLHVLSNFGVGGAETWLIALLRYFNEHAAELGCDVRTDIFLSHGYRDKLDGEAESLGARLIYARYSRKTMLEFVRTWRRTLAVGNYDAIHDHQEFTAGWHFLLGLGHLPPVRIAHLHNSMGHQETYSSGRLRKMTLKCGNSLVARLSTHLLSTSKKLIGEQGFHELAAARNLTKRAVYCGFDPSRFRGEQEESRADVCAEFGLPFDAKILLFVGRLDSHHDESLNVKNPGFALNVARECVQRDDRFRCLVAGGGEQMLGILRERVVSWGMARQILLLGPRQDVPSLMLGSDLLIFPSLAEGLGMVAVEAQAAGLPVIASDTVPTECRVIDSMVEFLPLGAGASYWAGKVLEKLDKAKPDPDATNRSVAASPFSIDNSAKTLLAIYRGES